MFVLDQSDTYNWPVTLLIPTDNGKKVKATFDVEYRRLTQTRINELVRQAKKVERARDPDDSDETLDQDTAREIIAGWGESVVDKKGDPVPFSEAALNKLLDIPTTAAQLVRQWFDSIDAAKRKN